MRCSASCWGNGFSLCVCHAMPLLQCFAATSPLSLVLTGSWSRTLTLSDSLSSQAGGRRSTEWLAGTTGALQQLGCYRLIRSYCQGMAPEARQGACIGLHCGISACRCVIIPM